MSAALRAGKADRRGIQSLRFQAEPRKQFQGRIFANCIDWFYFATTDRDCSANYIVGKDGSIGLAVDEADRSWCSSSRDNDNRAITIEVASERF